MELQELQDKAIEFLAEAINPRQALNLTLSNIGDSSHFYDASAIDTISREDPDFLNSPAVQKVLQSIENTYQDYQDSQKSYGKKATALRNDFDALTRKQYGTNNIYKIAKDLKSKK